MRKLFRKNWFAAAAAALVMGLVTMMTAQLLIRHLSVFLSIEPQFQRIFRQLLQAKMGWPLWLLIPAWGISWLAVKLHCRKRSFWVGIVMVLGTLVLLVGALYFTPVNGVLFGDVMVSLLDVIGKGGLDGL